MRNARPNLLINESLPVLREMLQTAEREVGSNSQTAKIIRRTIGTKCSKGRVAS